jgi:hypothetical protein
MTRQKYIKNHGYLRNLLFLLILQLLVGCDPYQDEKRKVAKYQATVNPENGRIVEINGEEFRIVYIGGVRFRFPEKIPNGHIGWTGISGGPVTGPETDGVHISFCWPDIPFGKVPDAKCSGAPGEGNLIDVIVTGTEMQNETDKSKVFGLPYYVNPDDYIVRDDLKLGLRIFSEKGTPNNPSYAHSLTDDAITPVDNKPVIVTNNYIYFRYAPKIEVRINMMMYGNPINPNWKGIYLGVVETLNKYREDKQ